MAAYLNLGYSHTGSEGGFEPVNSLWIGKSLGLVERLSIASFLAAGHRFRLHLYTPVEGVPKDVEICDASAVLPLSESVVYRHEPDRGSPALFACLWRFAFLHQFGGYWVDADQFCLRPFDFAAEYVFASEHHPEWPSGHPNVNVIRVPPGMALMADCIGSVRKEAANAVWGVGPRAITAAIREYGLEKFVLPPEAFCPVPWQHAEKLLIDPEIAIPEHAYGVHLWGQQFRRNKWHLDERNILPGCLLSQMIDHVRHLL